MSIKKWKQFNESNNENIWDVAYNNTITKVYYSIRDKNYLHTCKTCDDIVDNTETDNRQMLGNVYQTITICDKCKNPFVLDEHENYNWFLENKDKVLKEHNSKIKPMQHIKITKEPLINDNDEKVEISEKIGDYYVYVGYTNTDYEMDRPPEWHTDYPIKLQWNLCLEYPSGSVYSPYPYPNDNDGHRFPQDIIDIFDRFVR